MSDRKAHERQRDFERYALDFLVEVDGLSRSDEPFSDRGKMRNISGSGMCYITDHPDWYVVGQKLNIHVCLPGTDNLDASMSSEARVIWVHFSDQQNANGDSKAMIGISVNGRMIFDTKKTISGSNPST